MVLNTVSSSPVTFFKLDLSYYTEKKSCNIVNNMHLIRLNNLIIGNNFTILKICKLDNHFTWENAQLQTYYFF